MGGRNVYYKYQGHPLQIFNLRLIKVLYMVTVYLLLTQHLLPCIIVVDD